MKKDIVVRFVGSAGDGLVSIGTLFSKIVKKHNLNLVGFRSYQSVIRGGYNEYQLRFSSDKVYSVGEDADIIILLNRHVAKLHLPRVNSGARIIYDQDFVDLDDLGYPTEGITRLPIPMKAIAKEITNLNVIKNIVVFGAISYILGLDTELVKEVILEQFGHKGTEVIDINNLALDKGIEFANEHGWKKIWEDLKFEKGKQMVITGNEAIALGMLAGGLKYYSGYPMTPATSIIHYLTKYLPKLGIIVKQTEDEIAAVGMAVGASYCGARAASGTSGGGFALMTEIVGMAAIQEIPLVIINSQRAGPSTGMATKTEQADLFQVFGASQGDFPKIIIAPHDIEDAFNVGIESLELAEKYQMVVIVLLDLYLSESIATVRSLNLKYKTKRYAIVDKVKEDYKRYKITESGVSPRTIPGTPNGMHFVGSSERNESGTSIASTLAGLPDTLPIREAMVQKRFRKLEQVLKELPPPIFEGPKDAPVTLVSWGSTINIVREARILLEEEGVITNHLHIKYISPFNKEKVKEILEKSKEIIMVEQNFTGQMQNFIRMETAIDIKHHIRRYDGELLLPSQIIQKVKEVLQ
ncbi:MAG: 2-oxoacid:acceptor oxidoreductase subunit alpha [Candidatus Heimdallarchaeaceae archaeon]